MKLNVIHNHEFERTQGKKVLLWTGVAGTSVALLAFAAVKIYRVMRPKSEAKLRVAKD